MDVGSEDEQAVPDDEQMVDKVTGGRIKSTGPRSRMTKGEGTRGGEEEEGDRGEEEEGEGDQGDQEEGMRTGGGETETKGARRKEETGITDEQGWFGIRFMLSKALTTSSCRLLTWNLPSPTLTRALLVPQSLRHRHRLLPLLNQRVAKTCRVAQRWAAFQLSES